MIAALLALSVKLKIAYQRAILTTTLANYNIHNRNICLSIQTIHQSSLSVKRALGSPPCTGGIDGPGKLIQGSQFPLRNHSSPLLSHLQLHCALAPN